MLIPALRSSLETADALESRKYDIFPYYLGKSRDESRRSMWDVHTRDVLGQREERGASQLHIRRSKSRLFRVKPPNQSALHHGIFFPRSTCILGPWLFYPGTLNGRKHHTRVKSTVSMHTNHQATDGVTMETLPSSLDAPPKPKYLMNVDTGEHIHDGYIVTLARMAGRAGDNMLETIEPDSDISSAATSDHLKRYINASSSQTAFWAGKIGFDRPQFTDTSYFLNSEPPHKAPLADGSYEDGISSSKRPR